MTIITLDELQMLGPKIPDIVPIPSSSLFGWIAGGAIRGWFKGNEKLSDVDVFFETEKAFNNYCQLLLQRGFKKISEHKNAVSFILDDLLVQCIRVKYYSSIEDLFNSFDFTVCQFAWNGTQIYSTTEAIISTLRNHLGVNKLEGNVVDSLRRAFKYTKKGYFPCNGTVMKIAQSLRGLSEEDIKKAVEVSPGGGSRLIRID